MHKQVLEGFEKKGSSSIVSWDTSDRRSTMHTGWSERTYDIKFLYGSPEVLKLHDVVVVAKDTCKYRSAAGTLLFAAAVFGIVVQ